MALNDATVEDKALAVSASHLEGKEDSANKDIHELIIDRQHEQVLLTSRLEGEAQKIKRIKRKLDIRLVFATAVLYVWAYIDRGNLGNALLAGMGEDLKLDGTNRYSTLAQMFFVTYILMELPSTLILRKVNAAIWLPSTVVVFGIITLGQGFVKSWGALLVCRLLLGFGEGAFITVGIYIIGMWYTRYEAQKRIAGFFVLGICSTGLSGLLAYGIQNMSGIAGYNGWRWIFIIEGLCTIVCGATVLFIMPDLPQRCTQRRLFGLLPPFFTAEEAEIVHARIEADRGDATQDPITLKSFLAILKDWKIWDLVLLQFSGGISMYAFAYFLPVILRRSFGYSVGKAQLYTFPPYAVAACWVMFNAWLGDKIRMRGPIILYNSIFYFVGVSMMAFLKDPNQRYAGVFIGIAGLNAALPTVWAYQHNNVVGQTKRAVSTGLMILGSALAGVVSGSLFRAKDAPDYRPALCTCMAFQGLMVVLVIKNIFIFRWQNRRADREEIVIEGVPGFRYTY